MSMRSGFREKRRPGDPGAGRKPALTGIVSADPNGNASATDSPLEPVQAVLGEAAGKRWYDLLVLPLAMSGMVGFFAAAMTHPVRAFFPALSGSPWVSAFVVFVGLLSVWTTWLLVNFRASGVLRWFEAGLVLVLAKVVAAFGAPLSSTGSEGVLGPILPRILDLSVLGRAEFLLPAFLGGIAWALGALSGNNWVALAPAEPDQDAPPRPSSDRFDLWASSPAASIRFIAYGRVVRRFLRMAAVLFIASAIAREFHPEVLRLGTPEGKGLAIHGLLFLLSGIVAQSASRLALALYEWEGVRARLDPALPKRWLGMGVALALVLGVASFVLPADVSPVSTGTVWSGVQRLSRLVDIKPVPVLEVKRKLKGDIDENQTGAPAMPKVPVPQVEVGRWALLLRVLLLRVLPLLVGIVVLGALVSTLMRNRAEQARGVWRVAAVLFVLWARISRAVVVGVWLMIRQAFDLLKHAGSSTVKHLGSVLAERRSSKHAGGSSERRSRRALVSEVPALLIRGLFAAFLEHAEKQGFSRPAWQTAYEYSGDLEQRISQEVGGGGVSAQREMRRESESPVLQAPPGLRLMTEAYVEARYSTHPMTRQVVSAVRGWVRETLKTLRSRAQASRQGGQGRG